VLKVSTTSHHTNLQNHISAELPAPALSVCVLEEQQDRLPDIVASFHRQTLTKKAATISGSLSYCSSTSKAVKCSYLLITANLLPCF